MIRTVLLDRTPPQAWRNGGGLTRELLAWPDAAAWQLRVSVADITRDGPFSAFPGIDRWFAVLEGAGVLLGLDGQRQMVTPASPALHFDGAAAPGCELLDGATRDLNFMARRDAGAALMQASDGDAEWSSPAPWRAVFCTTAARLQVDDTDAARLHAGTLAWSVHAAHQRWRLCEDVEGGDAPRGFWLSFRPHTR